MSSDRSCQMSRAALELLGTFQKEVERLEPGVKSEADAKGRVYLRKEITRLRDELEEAREAALLARRDRLRRLYALESTRDENTLAHLGYAFVPSQP